MPWIKLPSLCDSNYIVTRRNCDKRYVQAVNNCCHWWPCSWICRIFHLWAKWLCVLIALISRWFCSSSFNGGSMFLLTDGTVLVNENSGGYGTKSWWKLTPNQSGSYTAGTWGRVADSNVGRKYYASAVLADGRLIVAGGEYTDETSPPSRTDSSACEIYDPVADTWTVIPSPANLSGISDAPSCLLPDGRFFLGDYNSANTAIYNPTTNTWTAGDTKGDSGSEEGWVLLQDDTILCPQNTNAPGSEKYNIATGTWMNDASMTNANNLVEAASREIGPGVLLQDGRAFIVGTTSRTALYSSPAVNTNQGTWAVGPAIPQVNGQNMGSKDGPGCLMVNGHVLFPVAMVDGSRTSFNQPCYFMEFDPDAFDNGNQSLTRTADPANSNCPTYKGRMILLPNGEILFAQEGSDEIYAYSYNGSPDAAWKPVITACPAALNRGSTIQVAGRQFNGLSQAVGYGNDYAAATNYPLVRIRNTSSAHIRYCRTSNHRIISAAKTSTTCMDIATGNTIVTTDVEIPNDIETGEAELFVVANGIASNAFNVFIN